MCVIFQREKTAIEIALAAERDTNEQLQQEIQRWKADTQRLRERLEQSQVWFDNNRGGLPAHHKNCFVALTEALLL